ncbi:MAG: sugar ABC transporter permease [Bifidobacteriaceae bacterium]|jgi:ABC-type sugar transport system permease subunit|nr:sugar ABC transporter permease [Bifidobacteriaceae bacterium]
MLLPAVTGLSVFVLWPLARSIYLSFYQWNFYTDNVFVGWKNFADVLGDPKFAASVIRGLLFTAMVVPLQLLIAFAFASVARSVGPRMAGALKMTIYIPTVVSTVIASLIFVVIYQFSGGVANWLVGLAGAEPQAWLGDAAWALRAMTVPTIWIGLGLTSLIMLAGMLDVPESYYDSARLDGAGWIRQQIYITLPLMKNVFLYLLITGFTVTIQQFEIPLVMTSGGPADSTLLPNLLIFRHFRYDDNVGFSVAAAILLFAVIGSISALVFRLLRSEKATDA